MPEVLMLEELRHLVLHRGKTIWVADGDDDAVLLPQRLVCLECPSFHAVAVGFFHVQIPQAVGANGLTVLFGKIGQVESIFLYRCILALVPDEHLLPAGKLVLGRSELWAAVPTWIQQILVVLATDGIEYSLLGDIA